MEQPTSGAMKRRAMSSEPQSSGDIEGPEPPSLWKLFNLPEPRRYDDLDAPEVDRQLLGKLIRKELSRDAAAAVYMLIDAFDSWRKAFAELVIEDFHEKHPPGSELPDG
jgi:hypothetical protein